MRIMLSERQGRLHADPVPADAMEEAERKFCHTAQFGATVNSKNTQIWGVVWRDDDLESYNWSSGGPRYPQPHTRVVGSTLRVGPCL